MSLKTQKLSSEARSLQTLQNNMIRVVQCVNMQRLREKVRIMSVNQMVVYHTILEVYNIMHNSSSEQIKNKYTHQERHSHRSKANNQIKVPEKPMTRCTGFTYCGAKLFNRLPNNIKETQDIHSF